MEYELINPSDKYTFVADDFETASLMVIHLSPLYGATAKDGNEKVPVFLFGDPEEWYKEQFGRDVYSGLKAKKEQVVAALNSIVLGGFEDRRRYEAALAAITDPGKKSEFISKWQDGRTSLNDIGGYCRSLAETLATHDLE